MAVNHVDFAIGEVIRIQRRGFEMQQADLAKALGISQASMSRKESGKESLTMSQLFDLAFVFNVWPQDLIKLALNIMESRKVN